MCDELDDTINMFRSGYRMKADAHRGLNDGRAGRPVDTTNVRDPEAYGRAYSDGRLMAEHGIVITPLLADLTADCIERNGRA